MKNKKMLLGFGLVMLLVLAAMGTMAWYTNSFESDNNTATAATYDVDVTSGEGVIGNEQFDLVDELYPGMDPDVVYSFDVNYNNTEVPVEYTIELTPGGELFPAGSPARVILQRNSNGNWVEVSDFDDIPIGESDPIHSYQIVVDWPHSNNDTAYQGKTGNIDLKVTATQVD